MLKEDIYQLYKRRLADVIENGKISISFPKRTKKNRFSYHTIRLKIGPIYPPRSLNLQSELVARYFIEEFNLDYLEKHNIAYIGHIVEFYMPTKREMLNLATELKLRLIGE